MILNCPSCSAKFMISSEALGAHGRDVRCGKCGHMWFQASERDSLDELPVEEISLPPERHSFDDDIAFETHTEIPSAIKPVPEVEAEPVAQVAATARQKQIASVSVALALTSLLFYGLIASRENVGRAVPFMARAYETMGFPLTPVKPQIAIDKLRVEKTAKAVTGRANLINLTSDDVVMGDIVADLTDFDYKTLKTTNVKPVAKTIKGEGTQKIEFKFEATPENAVSVRLKVSQ